VKRTRARARAVVTALVAAAVLAVPAGAAAAAPRDGAPASAGAPAASAPSPSVATTADARPCARAGRAAGWRGDVLVTAVAVAMAESGCTEGATNSNGPTAGCPGGSLDRGAWQINDCYQPQVSDACAFDLWCNAEQSYLISGRGADFTPWVTYNTGAHQRYWQVAVDAVNAPSGGGNYTVRTGTGDGHVNLRSGPGSGYTRTGEVADAATVTLSCHARGTGHEGPWGSSDLWNRLTDGSWISDAFVYTGTSQPVVPAC
jgi:hypothetical protein